MLEDGRVLLVGGHFRYRPPGPLDTSAILDPVLGTSTATGSFGTSRTTAGIGGTIALADGRIWSGSPWTAASAPAVLAEIWDPRTGAWTGTGTQGEVLVAGGWDLGFFTSEIYTPCD